MTNENMGLAVDETQELVTWSRWHLWLF